MGAARACSQKHALDSLLFSIPSSTRLAVSLIPRFARRARIAVVSMTAIAALGLTACSGGGPLGGGGDIDTVSEGFASSVDGAVASAMELSGSTEAVVGIWDSEGNAYVRGYGDGVDATTRIRGAQATQPVMCALLLDLVDQGRITLDREVSKDLTRQVGIEGVTYGQLCDMRSGLADFKGDLSSIFVNNPTRPWAEQELLAQGLSKSPLPWPGLDFNQSDTNVLLLGRALSVKTRQPLSELLDEHVYSKAGMGSSYYPATTATTVSGTTLAGLAYPLAGGKPDCETGVMDVPEVAPAMLGGAGATVTTVTDLKNFYEHYVDGTFGGKAAKVITDTIPTVNPKRDADGKPTEEPAESLRTWAFDAEKYDSLYGRAGAITGTLTAAYHDPKSGFSVVISLNNSSAGAGFARSAAFQLAALAAEAGTGPEISWTADEQAQALAKAAVCQ